MPSEVEEEMDFERRQEAYWNAYDTGLEAAAVAMIAKDCAHAAE